MEARVKKNARFPTYIFFSGHEYVKTEWRAVPAGFEDQALDESLVETRGEKAGKPAAETAMPVSLHSVDPETLMEPEEDTKNPYTRRGRRSKKEETEPEG